jgi:hypothetical protein
MPALIGRDRDPLCVLLNRRIDDFDSAAIVAKVDDLGAAGLGDTAKDIDCRVMPIEQ